MAPKSRNLNFEQVVRAPAEEIYRAFTNATMLRGWLCEAAQADPRINGRLYLWWNHGYYMCGEFTRLIPNESIGFTWHGRGDPGDTEVAISLAEKEGHTCVLLKQMKVKSRGSWIRFRDEIQHSWTIGLENLASILETGQDLRIVRRPFIGVSTGDYGKERAIQLGVPVVEGIRLEEVVPEMGADLAGLQKNDVIVSLSGKPVSNASELSAILRGKQAGDKIEIVYYRGSKINITSIQLSTRSLPVVPETNAALRKIIQFDYERIYGELWDCLTAASEIDAAHPPAPGEWSAKAILAHLIHSERDLHAWISDLINCEERVTDGSTENVQARISATLHAYPQIQDLLSEFQLHQKETLSILENLPEEFRDNRGNYWRMGNVVLQMAPHIRAHIEQLKEALKTARA